MAIKIEFTAENKGFMRSITEIKDAVTKTSRLLEQVAVNIGKAGKVGTSAAQETGRAIDRTDSSVRKLSKDVDESSKGFGRLEKAAGAFFTLNAAKDFAQKIFTVRSEIESLQTSFRVLVGDKGKADALFQSIKEFAVTTPMQMNDLAAAAQTMMGFGIPLEQIMDNLKAIGDVSMGDAQKFQGLALSFSQMTAAGKLMGQDLMQMINAGFNPLAIISERTGKSIGALKEEMEKGAISADMVRQAFVDATSEGGKFNGMLEEQSKTLRGAYSNLQGAIDDMLNDVGEKTQGVFASAMDAATYMAKNYETVGKIILTVVAAFGAYKAVLMVTTALQKGMALASSVSAFMSLAKSVTSAKDAMALFNLVTKANPIGLVLSAVAAAAAAFGLFSDKVSSAADYSEKFGAEAEKATTEVKSLAAIVETTTSSSKVHRDAIKELTSKYKDYGIEVKELKDDYSNEAEVVDDLIGKHDALTAAIRAESIERQKANAIQTISDEYQKKLSEVWGEVQGEIGGDNAATVTAAIKLAISDQDLAKLGQLEAQMQKVRDVTGDTNALWASKEHREYIKFHDELSGRLEKVASRFDVSEKSIAYANRALIGMGKEVYNANQAFKTGIATVEDGARSLEGYSDSADRAAYANRLGKMSVQELKAEIQSLINSYNNTTIGVKIVYDEVNVPAWMQGMDLKETRRLAEFFAGEVRNNPNAKEYNVNGHKFTKDEMLERSAQYLKASEQKAPKVKSASVTTPTRTSSGGRGGSNRGGGSTWDAKKAAAERERLMAEWGDELAGLIYDVEQDIADATVEALDESTEKTLKKLDEDEKKELHELEEKREELIKNRRKLDLDIWEKTAQGNTEANFKAKSNEEYLKMIESEQPGLIAALAKREEQITDSFAKQRKEVQDAELAKMRDYLKQYGDLEQQRLAITEEYAEKIAKAQNPYERASLAVQRGKQLEELDTKAAGERIDWGGVFASLEGHTKQYLEGLRDQLQAILSAGNLPVDQMAVVQGKLREVNDALSQQSDMLSFVGEKTREHNRLLQEQADAQKELDAARSAEVAAENNLQLARMRYSEGKGSQDEVLVAEAKLRDARKKTADATVKAKQKEDAAAEDSADKIARKFVDAAEWVNKYLGDLPDFLEKIGLDSASEKTQMGIDAVNDAAGAAADYASGNYVGAAMKAFSALDNIGNIIGVGGLSDPKLEQDIERLTQSNENLQKAIDALAEELTEASVLDVKDIYEQQKRMLEENARNTREMMQRSGAAYDSGFWGTGIGGSHSSNYKINDALTASDWGAVSRAAGKAIRDAAGFWNLSSKEMYQVMRDANAQWTVIMDKANDGTADAAQFMNEYIELWKKQEEIENAYKERWTNVSFDSVKDGFLSALSDMDKSAYDFSEDFTKYLFDAVMNAQVGDMLEKELKGWYDDFSKYMESGAGELTDSEIAALRERWDSIVKEGVSMRDAISRATGYGSSSEGSATFNAAKSFSLEQGDILNGRLAMIQQGQRENIVIAQQMLASLQQMEALSTVGASTNTAVTEIRNMMINTNSYLEDVARYAKSTYKDFGQKLDTIVYNLNNKL